MRTTKFRDQSEENLDHGSNTTRRPFLVGLVSSIGATVASTLGLSTTASALTSHSSLKQRNQIQKNIAYAVEEYNTEQKAQATIEEYGTDLTVALSNLDFLQTGSIDEWKTDSFMRMDAYQSADEGMHVSGFKHDGGYAAHLTVSKQTPTHRIELNIQPQRDETYAFVEEQDGDGVSVIEAGQNDITPTKFCGVSGTNCPPSCCSGGYPCASQVFYERVCCRLPGGGRDCHRRKAGCCDPIKT